MTKLTKIHIDKLSMEELTNLARIQGFNFPQIRNLLYKRRKNDIFEN